MILCLIKSLRDHNSVFLGAVIVIVLTAWPAFEQSEGSVAIASEAESAIDLGDIISGTLEPPGDEDTFGFDAVAGTLLSLRLRMSTRNGTVPEIRLFDSHGDGLDVTPFTQVKVARRSVTVSLKKMPIGETGHYILAVSIPVNSGEYRLTTIARFPHRIRQGGRIGPGEERALVFHALSGAKITIAIRKARKNPLDLRIASLTSSAGETLQVENFTRSHRGDVVLRGLELDQLGVYQLRFRNMATAAGIYKIEGVIKPPKRRARKLVARESGVNPDPNGPEQIWQFQTGGPVRAKPFVDGGVIYVGSNDGHVYALDTATGGVHWQYETGAPILSSPTSAYGLVYFGCNDGRIYALDKADGSFRWSFETGGIVQSSPAVEGDSVFVASYDGSVYALDASGGQMLWQFQTGNLIWTSPIVVGGTLFVGSTDGYLYAIGAGSGELLWQYTTSWNYIVADPIVKDGSLYVAAYEERAYAFDAATGAVKWIHYGGNWITTLPLLNDGVLYYGVAAANTLYALDVSTGLPIWQSNVLEPRQTILFVKNSELYAMSKGGVLAILDTATGEVGATYELNLSLNALSLSHDGKLFISSEDNGVLAFSL